MHGEITVAYIPVLKRPAGTDVAAFSRLSKRLFAACWDVLYLELQAIIDSRESLKLQLQDGSLRAWPCPVVCIADHPELQEYCGVNAAWNALFPCRLCHEKFESSGQFFTQAEQAGGRCKPRDRQQIITDIAAAKLLPFLGRQAALQKHSLTGVYTAHLRQDCFGSPEGVLSATPSDMMHMINGGCCKDMVEFIFLALKGVKRSPGDRCCSTEGILSAGLDDNDTLKLLTDRLRCVPLRIHSYFSSTVCL